MHGGWGSCISPPAPGIDPGGAAVSSAPEIRITHTVVADSIREDREIESLVAPFRNRMGDEIRQVIGEAAVPLAKAIPEGTLGNFATDAMLWAARRQLAEPVHMAMTNNGGLRIPIAPGPITVGQMFELMPFENMLSVLTLSGAQIQELADQLAAMRGEPIAGFSFRIGAEGDGRVARDLLIDGAPVDPAADHRRDRTMRRRRFLRAAGAATVGGLLLPEWLKASENTHLVILHTNDTHSRMDPFPMDGGRFEGLGGAARRAMSAMEYDVTTIGNHDFDNGVEGIVEMMPHATFQFVSSNYDVSASLLAGQVRPWTIREIGGVRVGIFGLGIAFEGLVLEQLHEGVRYTDPFAAARRSVSELQAQGCSLIICLSHLGYRYRGDRPSDTLLAQEVEGIDLILGGHTHTFMDQPDVYTKPHGRQTLVNQVGWAGMRLGRVDVVMGTQEGRRSVSSSDGIEPRLWSWESYSVDKGLD